MSSFLSLLVIKILIAVIATITSYILAGLLFSALNWRIYQLRLYRLASVWLKDHKDATEICHKVKPELDLIRDSFGLSLHATYYQLGRDWVFPNRKTDPQLNDNTQISSVEMYKSFVNHISKVKTLDNADDCVLNSWKFWPIILVRNMFVMVINPTMSGTFRTAHRLLFGRPLFNEIK